MIAKIDDIREKVRQITKNIQEIRVEPYIAETEGLDIIPSIGASLYRRIDEQMQNPPISETLEPEVIEAVKEGAYYTSCNTEKFAPSLLNAIAYLAYARFLRQNMIHASAFGVTVKKSDFSEPAKSTDIARAASNAERVGIDYLTQFKGYLKFKNLLPCKTGESARKRIIRRIKNT